MGVECTDGVSNAQTGVECTPELGEGLEGRSQQLIGSHVEFLKHGVGI